MTSVWTNDIKSELSTGHVSAKAFVAGSDAISDFLDVIGSELAGSAA
jgi:hypothetical protein